MTVSDIRRLVGDFSVIEQINHIGIAGFAWNYWAHNDWTLYCAEGHNNKHVVAIFKIKWKN